MTSARTPEENALQDLRVLIVEDEALVAMLIEDYLTELGCIIVCSATRVSKAMESLDSVKIDAAILDVNVAGEAITPLATALSERGIPFVFASGYGARGIDPLWAACPMLQKPFTAADLQNALLTVLKR